MMTYKGYTGSVEYSEPDQCFHGVVLGIRDMVTFEGESVAELKKAFKDSVDDYLEFCSSRGEEPNKPFSGRFVTRISPELHRQATNAALSCGQSLNTWVAEQLQTAVNGGNSHNTKKQPHKRIKASAG